MNLNTYGPAPDGAIPGGCADCEAEQEMQHGLVTIYHERECAWMARQRDAV